MYKKYVTGGKMLYNSNGVGYDLDVQSRLYRDIEYLTTVYPYRNYLNVDSLNVVSNYIEGVFIDNELNTSRQKIDVNGIEYYNIIGLYEGDGVGKLVVGAHYDVCGNQCGADDNASGVSGLLEISRLLNKYKPKLNYSIELVAYCLEEPPFFLTNKMGSYIHAKSLFDKKEEVIGMICLEMIGYFSELENSQSYPNYKLYDIYPNRGNFIFVVGLDKNVYFNEKVKSLMSSNLITDVHMINFPECGEYSEYISLSDQINYIRMGYNAVMINDTSFFRNPHYHRSSDTIDTLNFEKMYGVIKGVYNAVVNF